MVKEAREKYRQVFLVGASGEVKAKLGRLKVLELLSPQNQVATRFEALQQASTLLGVEPAKLVN